MFETFFLYIIISSTTLVYGIGLKKLFCFTDKPQHLIVHFLKSLFCIVTSISLTWLITNYLLAPFDMSIVYPFFAVLFSVSFGLLFQRYIFSSLKIDTAEFMLTFLSIILAVGEGSSYVYTLLIGISSCLSYYILIPFLFAIYQRIQNLRPNHELTTIALIFISLAFIIFALYSWNVSWLNIGVYQ